MYGESSCLRLLFHETERTSWGERLRACARAPWRNAFAAAMWIPREYSPKTGFVACRKAKRLANWDQSTTPYVSYFQWGELVNDTFVSHGMEEVVSSNRDAQASTGSAYLLVIDRLPRTVERAPPGKRNAFGARDCPAWR